MRRGRGPYLPFLSPFLLRRLVLLLVGLGNPGPPYRSHRHNVGFMVLDALHARVGASEWREKFNGLAAKAVVAGREAWLLKPQTFMNASGRAVQKALTQCGIKLRDVVVVHDDLDLPFGEVRVKVGGGHGGHNGLRDISNAVGSDYVRVRVGIGRPTQGSVEHFVLSPFTKEEQAELDAIIERAVDAVIEVCAKGPEAAMNKFNVRSRSRDRSK